MVKHSLKYKVIANLYINEKISLLIIIQIVPFLALQNICRIVTKM